MVMSPEEGKGGLERRVAERVDCKLAVDWVRLDKSQADAAMTGGDYSELFSITDLGTHVSAAELESKAYTENLSVTGVKLVGDLRLNNGEALQEGWELMVQLHVPNAPLPVRALALVVWIGPSPEPPGALQAGLFFKGIHKQDVEKVTRFMVLQKRAQHG
jgi:hypothetical protein